MMLPRFFAFENYEIIDLKEFLSESRIDIYLSRKTTIPARCHRCLGLFSGACRGDHQLRIEAMPIMGNRVFLHFRRFKYHCDTCKKARSEAVPFLAEETPHLTKDLAWWIGRLCEIASVSRVAELVGHDGMTTWRLDFNRMIAMLTRYRVPGGLKKISVDEVYARKRKPRRFEDRDVCYFTVITDLETRKVIWVADSRRKAALDSFFKLIGPEACRGIEVVAADQHEAYASSVREFCPKACLVWDRFHIIKNFEEVLNQTRLELHLRMQPGPLKRLTRSGNKYCFMKRADRRSSQETRLIEEVMRENEDFYKLEIIKERMLSFFDEPDEMRALFVWTEIGEWIRRSKFYDLIRWYEELSKGWETLKNYFKYRVTTSVSEGINNVIKTLKRKAYGYRNMGYFKLKIMQVCGYLNSRLIHTCLQGVALI